MSGPFGSSQWMYASGGFYDFPISNSLRFEDGDSAYLNRTPSASNRRTWTWSGWVKRSTIITSNQNCFFGAWADDNNRFKMNFYQDKIEVVHVSGGTSYNFKITQLFRDVSAWYHIVLAVDTTQGTDTNRYKIYINGEQVTAFDNVAYPAQNFDGAVNSAIEHTHGESDGSANYLDGYLAEVNFIDGTALTPASFGELKNDIWIPKNTSGLTFGSQGFRLQFKQSGTGTASSSTIGADTSGNTNHWTSNNLVASDVVLDSPTNNFATLNPLHRNSATASNNPILTEGATVHTSTLADYWQTSIATIGVTSGKWYFEAKIQDSNTTLVAVGMGDEGDIQTWGVGNGYLGAGKSLSYGSGSSAYTHSNIIGIAVDVDNGKVYWAKDNTYINSGNPAGNANGTAIPTGGVSNGTYFLGVSGYKLNGHAVLQVNFGGYHANSLSSAATDANGYGTFEYAPPTGYYALCTKNLAEYG